MVFELTKKERLDFPLLLVPCRLILLPEKKFTEAKKECKRGMKRKTQMISISDKIVASSITRFKTTIDSFTEVAHTKLVSLEKREKSKLNQMEKRYLSNIISDISAIIIAPPKSLLAFQKKYGIVPKRNLRKKKGRKSKTFKDKIIDALGYNKLRSDFYPEYFQKIGIKSCVYCNAQLAVSVDSEDSKKKKITKAKFQGGCKLNCVKVLK